MTSPSDITVEYDGEYPCLCAGRLVVTAAGKRWDFGDHCLRSGGNVWFDDNWSEHVDAGPWTIEDWPEDFPENQREAVAEAVNDQVPLGCCGGCV